MVMVVWGTQPTVCGNGVCEGPDEYPGFGRFGCQEDCGRHFNRTTLRIDLAPVWEAPGGPLAELRERAVFGAGTSLPVGFRCPGRGGVSSVV